MADRNNKFWAGSSSSSDTESSSSDDDKGVKKFNKEQEFDVSSSDESDGGRVVRTAREKYLHELREVVYELRDSLTGDDMLLILSTYESLMKLLGRTTLLNPVPLYLVRVLIDLDKFITSLFEDKERFKKLSQNKAKTFNALRSKVRKQKLRDDIVALMEQHQENPPAYDVDSEDDDDAHSRRSSSSSSSSSSSDSSSSDSSSSDSSSDSSSSDSDSDKEKQKKKSGKKTKRSSSTSSSSSGSESGSESDSDSSSSSSSSSSDESIVGESLHDRALRKWGVESNERRRRLKVEMKEKEREKNQMKNMANKKLHQKYHMDDDLVNNVEDNGDSEDDDEDIQTAEQLANKINTLRQLRGKKGFNKSSFITRLCLLLEKSKSFSPSSQLLVLSLLVPAQLEASPGLFNCLSGSSWESSCVHTNLIRQLLSEDSSALFTSNAHIELMENVETSTVNASGVDSNSRMESMINLTFLLCKLDEELMKALQFSDETSPEYVIRLKHSIQLFATLYQSFKLFEKSYPKEATTVALKIVELIYYMSSKLLKECIMASVKYMDKEHHEYFTSSSFNISKFIKFFIEYINQYSTDKRTILRSLLCYIFNLSLEGNFALAYELLIESGVQKIADKEDISCKILYNRALVMVGVAAFCNGRFNEAYMCLTDVCALGKSRELLAQGVSNNRIYDKTLEEERSERLRQLPFHYHIHIDIIDSIYSICSMIIELYNMTDMNCNNPNVSDSNRRLPSRHFRKILEIVERQIYTVPPENNRESVAYASKSLMDGDWKSCIVYIQEMNFWGLLNENQSKTALKLLSEEIKKEALRMYMLSYAKVYSSFTLSRLSDLFDLTQDVVASVISKGIANGEFSLAWMVDDQSIAVRMEK